MHKNNENKHLVHLNIQMMQNVILNKPNILNLKLPCLTFHACLFHLHMCV